MNLGWKYALAVEVPWEPWKSVDGVMYVNLVYKNGTKYEMHSPKDSWTSGRNVAYFKQDFEIEKITNVEIMFLAEKDPVEMENFIVMRMVPSWENKYFCGEKRPFLLTNGTWFTLVNKC